MTTNEENMPTKVLPSWPRKLSAISLAIIAVALLVMTANQYLSREDSLYSLHCNGRIRMLNQKTGKLYHLKYGGQASEDVGSWKRAVSPPQK